MSGGVVLTCNGGEVGCERMRLVPGARSWGAARARAALHGWTLTEGRGEVLDWCPVCSVAVAPPLPSSANTDRLVAVLADELAASAGGPRHAARLLPEGVEVCAACGSGDHWLCRSSGAGECPCPALGHARASVRPSARL